MRIFNYDKKYYDPNELPLQVNGSFINDDSIPFVYKGLFAYLSLPQMTQDFDTDILYEKVKYEISRDKFDEFINILIDRKYINFSGMEGTNE